MTVMGALGRYILGPGEARRGLTAGASRTAGPGRTNGLLQGGCEGGDMAGTAIRVGESGSSGSLGDTQGVSCSSAMLRVIGRVGSAEEEADSAECCRIARLEWAHMTERARSVAV